MHRTVKVTALALVLAAAAAPSSDAQVSSRGNWQAWLGCWTAAPVGASYGSAQFAAPVVCIVPTASSSVVDVVTVAEGKVVSTDRLDASGGQVAIDVKGCTGTKLGQWSKDERRVFLKSDMNCDGVRSTATSLLAITPEGEWLDIRGVASGGGSNVRTARYREVGIPAALPAENASALRNLGMGVQGARLGAGATIGTSAVIEAASITDSTIVEAWLLEHGQRFALNARELIALSDAGMPAKVTDAMVAVSNPRAFTVARSAGSMSDDDDITLSRGRRIPVYMDPYNYPWSYGYSRYGNGYGYGYPGYGGYYGGTYGGYYGGAPIIVVQGQSNNAARGQYVKGQGYTSNQPANTSSRSGNDRSASSSSGSSSPSPSTSSTSGSASQPASSTTEARTAKPRP